ncbi:hypothetical protein BD410DRAFT_791720 [Rickenella mellea]|uniref:F-box domain-containing protein n=1 Tax=Rickenella mellea TaxID=50990 RepID=A0A4Y7PWP0_9AGAM|nr:hypothetical protein BD410DRAFT_791720 [Rickenella mellea]
MATMQTLPSELLSEIFWHSLHHRIDFHAELHLELQAPDDFMTRTVIRAPLLLGRVCSRWRTVSISTPKLWSYIAIGGHNSNMSENYRKDMEATQVWINRSGTYPLSFHIHHFTLIHQPGMALRQTLHSVGSQSWRWKSLRAFIPIDFMKILRAPLMEGNIANLEDLHCHLEPGFDSKPFALSSAPRLKRLYVHGEPFHIELGDQIHHIELIDIQSIYRKFSLGELLRYLNQFPSLTTLALPIHESFLPHELPTRIEHLNLRFLTLQLHHPIDPGPLFDRLVLPSLTSLMMSMEGLPKSDWPHLVPMLKRSCPPLHSLYLFDIPITEGTLIECLSYTPHLIELDVGFIECSDTILASLTIDNAHGRHSNLCPHLQRFGTISASFSEIAFKNMILSRCLDHASPTTDTIYGKSLKIVNCPSYGLEGILLDPDIRRCIRNGLKLVKSEMGEEWEEVEEDGYSNEEDGDEDEEWEG